jgi:hypothetical protein
LRQLSARLLGWFRRKVWVSHGPEPILKPTGHGSMQPQATERADADPKVSGRRWFLKLKFESPRRRTQHWKIAGTRTDTNVDTNVG